MNVMKCVCRSIGGLSFILLTMIGCILLVQHPVGATEQINVAVTDFVGSDSETGRMVGQIIEGALASVPNVTVVDRGHLEQILKEQRLNISGFVDMSSLSSNEVGSLCQVGQLAGATHLVTGAYSLTSQQFVLTINLVSIATGVIEDSTVAASPSDEYFASVLSASNRFAGKIAGKSLDPSSLFGKLELIVNVEWNGGELQCDPRTDLKSRIEQASGLAVISRDITGQQMAGTLTTMFKDDLAVEGGIKAYASGMNPILLVNFQPIPGPASGNLVKYKARMYWAAYYPALGGAVVHGVVETNGFGSGMDDAQAVSQAVSLTYDMFTTNNLYKIVGDFGSVGNRTITLVVNGGTKQDHMSYMGILKNELGVSSIDYERFTGGVSTFKFSYSGSIDEIKEAFLANGKLKLSSFDNESLTFRKVI
jgi:hypothetical protein